MERLYLLLADLVLVTHFLFVLFVVFGLLLIILGGWRRWSWVRNWWFRMAHLAAIAVVVLQAWLGQICPLTILEMWLRTEAGEVAYQGSFIQHWVSRVLYYRAPNWVFVTAYTGFASLVVLVWVYLPPRRRGGSKG